jgi:MFS family permease
MQSLFSLAQLVGGLLCGPLMDVYGARWGMSLAFFSGAVSYGMTAMSTSCARTLRLAPRVSSLLCVQLLTRVLCPPHLH